MNVLDPLKIALLKAAEYLTALQHKQTPPYMPPEAPKMPVEAPQTPTMTQTAPCPIPSATAQLNASYDWSTPEAVRHSVRVIADEEGLTLFQKNLMCQVIHCESGWNIHAINHNMVAGKVASTDYGLCQWNDYYHGKEISPDDAVNDPEKAVRLMCTYVKKGLIREWVCYSTGMYNHYTS
jgi:hypothetical protein